jgi:hypothetical protein
VSCRLKAVPITILLFFAELEKSILKFMWNLKGPPPPHSQNNLEKEEKLEDSHFLIAELNTEL